MTYNNYKHLISYILIKNPFSKQIKKTNPLNKIISNSFNNYINHNKKNILKISKYLLTTIPISFFYKTTITTIIKKINNSISQYNSSLPKQTINYTTKNIYKNTNKQLNYKSSQILKIKKYTNITQKTNKTTLKKTTTTTFLITNTIKKTFTTYKINKLKKQKKHNHINKTNFKQKITKKISNTTKTTIKSIKTKLIKQTIFPIPIINFTIKSTLKNIIKH